MTIGASDRHAQIRLTRLPWASDMDRRKRKVRRAKIGLALIAIVFAVIVVCSI